MTLDSYRQPAATCYKHIRSAGKLMLFLALLELDWSRQFRRVLT